MPASKAHQRASNKWIAKAYDRINLTVPKGQKDVIQSHAAARGESVNGFIGRAITETMERDNGGTSAEAAQSGTDAFSGGGATPILSGAKTPSEAAKNTVQGG